MAEKKQELPDLDAVCGQAAWMLAQVIANRLVANGLVEQAAFQEDLVAAISACRHDPKMNAAQREAGHLLAQFHTNLDYVGETKTN